MKLFKKKVKDVSEPRCFSCKFRDINNRCRRNPPIPVSTPHRDRYDHTYHEIDDYWPYVSNTDWCGEWKFSAVNLLKHLTDKK